MTRLGQTTAVLIVAAGRGSRLGGAMPKQYLELGGISILRRTIEQFLESDMIHSVRVVIHPDDHALYGAATQELSDQRLLTAVFGGDTRAQTTLNGLKSLAETIPDYVLIHDAARPFVTQKTIADVITALGEADGAFAGIPVVDALWQVSHDRAEKSVPRDGLWRAQTPQGFDFKKILEAHRTGQGDHADDVAIARAAGLNVQAVLGDENNFKITVAADLERAEKLLLLDGILAESAERPSQK